MRVWFPGNPESSWGLVNTSRLASTSSAPELLGNEQMRGFPLVSRGALQALPTRSVVTTPWLHRPAIAAIVFPSMRTAPLAQAASWGPAGKGCVRLTQPLPDRRNIRSGVVDTDASPSFIATFASF